MAPPSHFSFPDVTQGKSLWHVLSSNEQENSEGSHSLLSCSREILFILVANQRRTKQKADAHFHPLRFRTLSCNLQEKPWGETFLKQRSNTEPVSPLKAYLASGHFSTHLRGRCTCTSTNLRFNFGALCLPRTGLLIWKAFLFVFLPHLNMVCMSFWGMRGAYLLLYLCVSPKINFISKGPELFFHSKCLKKKKGITGHGFMCF